MNTPAPPVTAVTVTYQSQETLPDLLVSSRRCHDAGLMDLVVVDNASRDGTAAILGPARDWARVLLTGVNNGFGKGCNIGAAGCQSPYLLFLNPDARIEPDSIRRLILFFEEHPQAGIAGPAIAEPGGGPDGPWQVTGPLPTPWSVLREGLPRFDASRHYRDALPGQAPYATGWVCGAVLMIRTDLFRRLGGFDERFFMYWEEMDLARRAAALGYSTWVVGEALALHVGGASSAGERLQVAGSIPRYYFESRFHYMSKHHGRLAAWLLDAGEFAARWLLSRLSATSRHREWLLARREAALFAAPQRAT